MNTKFLHFIVGLLYRAPELLRTSTAPLGVGSQKGDVYAFGIILYELHSRRGPFGDNIGMTTAEIIHRVIHHEPSIQPLRYFIVNHCLHYIS